jgi:enediyne biosynthesis protein E5
MSEQHPIAQMYKSTILLLILVIAVSSYYVHQFPYSVVIAAVACTIIELAIKKLHHKRKFAIPYTAIITGMIIGSVAPSNASILLLVLASAIAILSKFYIKLKHSNIFNPAALGLLISLVIFGVGDAWWGSTPIPVYGVLIAITPLLAICAYDAKRLYLGLSFAITTLILPLALNRFIGIHSIAAIWTAIISVNYFLAFVMASEPKTTPHKKHAQIVYGVGIGVLVSLLSFYRVPYALLIPLIIGNIIYTVYRIKSGSR